MLNPLRPPSLPMARLTRLTAPAGLPATLQQLKDRLREDSDDRDDLLTDCLHAAVDYLDGANGALNRPMVEQQWLAVYDSFPWYDPAQPRANAEVIRLPLPPLISVDELAYTDAAGDAQVLTEGVDFTVTDRGCEGKARLAPAYGKCWPATRCEPGAVRISFTAGWAGLGSPADYTAGIPRSLRLLVLYLAGHWADNGLPVGPAGQVVLPFTIENLIARWRVEPFR